MIDLFFSSSGCGRYNKQQMYYKLQSLGSVTPISGKTTLAETQVFFSTNASNNPRLVLLIFLIIRTKIVLVSKYSGSNVVDYHFYVTDYILKTQMHRTGNAVF